MDKKVIDICKLTGAFNCEALAELETIVKTSLEGEARKDALGRLLELRVATRKLCRENLNLHITIDELDAAKSYIEANFEEALEVFQRVGSIELEEAEAKYKDLGETFDNWLNEVWSIVYPQDPTGWEYPAQVFRHIRDYVKEKEGELSRQKDIKTAMLRAAKNDREEQDTTISKLRETVTRLTGMLEFIDKKAEETLRHSYQKESIDILIDYLRESLRQIGLNAKYPFLCPVCKGSKKIVDTAASHIQNPCPNCSKTYTAKGGILDGMEISQEDIEEANVIKGYVDEQLRKGIELNFNSPGAFEVKEDEAKPPMGGYPPQITEYVVGIDPAKEGAEYTAESLIDTVNKIKEELDKDKPKSFANLFNVGEPFYAPGGIRIRESAYMPPGFGLFLGKDDFKIIKFHATGSEDLTDRVRESRIEALRAEVERQKRIDSNIRELLKQSKDLTDSVNKLLAKSAE